MTAKPVIWVSEPIHADAIAALRKGAELLGPGPLPEARAAEVSAIIVRSHLVDAALAARLPALRVVGKHGAGVDNIDMALMRSREIEVFRAEGANAQSVADLAVLLALTLLRAPHRHDHALRQGLPGDESYRVGFELAERRIGILGLGAIGREVAQRLTAGFGAKVAGHDPALPDALWPATVQRVPSVDTLLEDSDLLFLHLPLLPETRHVIDAAALARLGPGAFLVNCARGGIVDEAALARALHGGGIAGAAFDVFETEPPPPDHPLLAEGLNFIATPHLGASTQAGLRWTGMIIAGKVLAALEQGKETDR